MTNYLKQISDPETLLRQTEKLAQKRFRPGFDGMTAEGAKIWLQINGDHFSRELRSGGYAPMPACGFRTAKRNGKYRSLGKLTALDSIVQYAALEILQPVCEAGFSDSSFAYRPERGLTAALNRYCYLGNRYSFAAKLDMTACFDRMDHAVLRDAIESFFGEPALTDFLSRMVQMPVWEDGQLHQPERGVIQGAPISPLLCNLYFHAFDRHMEESCIPFLRYADDIVLFAEDSRSITGAVEQAVSFLQNRLRLAVNAEKCRIDAPARLRYLGYRFETEHRGMIALEADAAPQVTYRNWHESSRFDNHRRVDILSDGILRQKDYSILFDGDRQNVEIPLLSTDIINLYSSVVFDSGFLEKTASAGIMVNLFDRSGKLVGRFLPNTALHSPLTTQEQLACYYDEKRRAEYARQFVLASLHNCRLNIRYYQKQEELELYADALRQLQTISVKLKGAKDAASVMLLEAQVRTVYYSCFEGFLRQEGFAYEARTRRPPRNAFNSMLNFGNTMLYNLIATEIYRTSLDVRVGFLHATTRREESLNLDIAEIFKPLVVDRTVLTLINRRAIRLSHFREEENGGVYLNEEGKRILIRAFYEKLETVVTVGEEKMSYQSIITEEVRKLVRSFRSGEKYKPFKQIR